MNTILDEQSVLRNPIEQFKAWFDEANAANLPMPNAMTLATSTRDGRPSARIVLLKHADDRGFVFYTNFNSRKGRELSSNPFAALVFYWNGSGRQVRIEGSVKKVSEEESDSYFHTRPRESQVSAAVSHQSEVITGRGELERQWNEYQQQLANRPVPRPPHWGGYCLKPTSFEFWQNRESRLHDRILYEIQSNGSWKISRLAP
jgi:pyridoxamine 5'-phosphate oxidase